jgi:hypothetical protein
VRLFPPWVTVVVAVSVAAVLVALPLGFVNEAFAVAAGVFGLYFVLPMLLALGLVVAAERRPPPRGHVRAAVALVLPVWVLWDAYWALFLGPYGWAAGVASLAVVMFAALRLWRTSTSGSAASAAAGGSSAGSGGGAG